MRGRPSVNPRRALMCPCRHGSAAVTALTVAGRFVAADARGYFPPGRRPSRGASSPPADTPLAFSLAGPTPDPAISDSGPPVSGEGAVGDRGRHADGRPGDENFALGCVPSQLSNFPLK